MSTVREQFQQRYEWQAEQIAVTHQLREAAKNLGLLDADFYMDFGDGEYRDGRLIPGPYIKLDPKHVPGIALSMGLDGPTMHVVDTTPTLADAARLLMPKIGKWKKSFDEESNLLKLEGEYKGVRIILQDTPPETCTVEKIEEEVEVPEQVIAAHTETKVRYVLKGDCDPLLATNKGAHS